MPIAYPRSGSSVSAQPICKSSKSLYTITTLGSFFNLPSPNRPLARIALSYPISSYIPPIPTLIIYMTDRKLILAACDRWYVVKKRMPLNAYCWYFLLSECPPPRIS
ncbi:hypothetical protein EYC84_006714 [Monilinia fructicola]|uniref:Uncharacterized protein n=1 Tax=Monilinia fructicola TaxID=38448 RepID=A0A5M9K472_MONFR|nr:hypothetical protein EYC84_006714 [Monilinia fructicola]